MKKKAEELKTNQIQSQTRDTLLPNEDSMEKEENTSEVTTPDVVDEVVETPVTDEVEETQVSEETGETTEETQTEEENKIETLENEIQELKNSFAEYKSEMEAKFGSLKTDTKISQREENRAKVKKIFETS
jgi:hypothetical protein